MRRPTSSTGVYDIVAKVKAKNMDELREIVTYKIRKLDKVQSTQK